MAQPNIIGDRTPPLAKNPQPAAAKVRSNPPTSKPHPTVRGIASIPRGKQAPKGKIFQVLPKGRAIRSSKGTRGNATTQICSEGDGIHACLPCKQTYLRKAPELSGIDNIASSRKTGAMMAWSRVRVTESIKAATQISSKLAGGGMSK
ncbi:hypothetical protein Salat_1464800 [Sesamum alatum]|uniref:Uncharacterized protein n=1 Tax=Sesamum alatum TaxID=300844 RepID=A0AAE1YBB3_9LAMI|nr:hypothetical protein Salat_1464800 [Sesamum alatum]